MGIFKRKKEDLQSTKGEDLKASFTAVKEVEQTTRKVYLKYSSCCGCGCHNIDIVRWVPAESALQNGDFVDELEDDDEQI